MRPKQDGILRRIYFYRLRNAQELIPALPRELEHIEALPPNLNGRYQKDSDGNRHFVKVDRAQFPIRLRFVRTRLSGLPTREKSGAFEDLELSTDEGLAEIMHVMIFEDGYTVAEFNFDGPRIRALGPYLYAKRDKLTEKLDFLPLFQRDVVQLVKGMPVVKFLELYGSADAFNLMNRADQHVGGAFQALRNAGANKAIHLNLHAENHPESRLKKLSVKFAEVMQNSRHEARELMKKVTVRGVNAAGRIDEVDLLEDHLIAVKLIARRNKRSKGINSDVAYQKLNEAYQEHFNELAEAVQGRLFL